MVSDSYVEETMSQLVFSLPAQTLVPTIAEDADGGRLTLDGDLGTHIGVLEFRLAGVVSAVTGRSSR